MSLAPVALDIEETRRMPNQGQENQKKEMEESGGVTIPDPTKRTQRPLKN